RYSQGRLQAYWTQAQETARARRPVRERARGASSHPLSPRQAQRGQPRDWRQRLRLCCPACPPRARLLSPPALSREITPATGSEFVARPPPDALRASTSPRKRGRLSDRQRPLERSVIHVGAAAGIDDGAAVHHREMIAELLREIEILLDQHDRDLA